MTLHEYQKKRDFQKTPEPEGKEETPITGKRFVIHKHAATRLHYDLRLELGGTLKSWAVPRGPSLDPDEKRLAVHVEDHPMEYGKFEGIIPAGEYGGGTVMLWDQGYWVPEGDPDDAYHKGRLHFELHGKKLRGRWVLFRTGGGKSGEGKNWMLVKSRDTFAEKSEGSRILSEEDRSAATGRSMSEIASGESFGPSGLENARKTEMFRELRPQLPTLVDSPPLGEKWLHEIKYDGYRIVAFIENGSVRLSTRNLKDWTDRFRPIAGALSRFPAKQAVLDGEVVIQFPDGTTSFQALQNAMQGIRTGAWVYYLFDILYCDGFNLTRTPLGKRKQFLKQLLERMAADDPVIRFSDHVEGSGEKVYKHACRLSLEGIISKDPTDVYREGRNRKWVKVKCGFRQEFVIGGYTEPSGGRTGFGALHLGVYDDEENLRYCGKVGTGFNEEQLVSLKSKMSDLERKTPPFADPPKSAEARKSHWLSPEMVAEVAFDGWTRDHALRHPVFKGLREDKPARDIRRESLLPKRTAVVDEEPLPETRNPGYVRDVRLTNANRVLYPNQGATKADLAHYYEQVADYILPHVAHRPLSLVRCPRGRGKDCFYQKHFPESLPDFVRGIRITEKKSADIYIVIDDIRGLLSLVQMGVLEIHPWNAREDRIERPDLMIMDMDPAPGVSLERVVEGTLLLHLFLSDLGLRSFLKTSGGKGYHVVVPLTRRSGWDEVKSFAGAIARQMARAHPDRFVDTMSKKKREGKIFIDYFRNNRGATSVAPYSTRSRPGAPISAPIAWEAIPETAPDAYGIDNILKLIGILEKNDPWKDFSKVNQSITKVMKERVGVVALTRRKERQYMDSR